jgi:hypothetical protein
MVPLEVVTEAHFFAPNALFAPNGAIFLRCPAEPWPYWAGAFTEISIPE